MLVMPNINHTDCSFLSTLVDASHNYVSQIVASTDIDT